VITSALLLAGSVHTYFFIGKAS